MLKTRNITIRNATAQDLDTLVAFQQAMAQETEGKTLDVERLYRGIRAVLESPDKGFYLVAEAGGRVVGCLFITYEWSDWRAATFWWIQSVYVDAQWRRKGVYRALYSYVYEAARSRDDICGIRLYVDRDNHVAQQTYANLGMTHSHYDLYEVDFVL
jgi:GNAT superfamily N-acetyltransferase